ncbi:hypothetical protein JM946_03630 [Steroidobacter sp. S1-65]|uniref:Uncharacterized protein n=1 Tax=Steroidobacter gossypii TaxID=2805490 RepID=A0ABS1WS65_9GAMM|nr:hypothetical protein [Steroidobacter gossypii]MBM0103815.1 hypothetical protein [Steroidobacter gossypii]
MIERPIPVTPRVRAGVQPQPASEPSARHWMHERAPSFRTLNRDRQRREKAWAWLSLVVLVICWDASSRLDEPVSLPRARMAHAVADDELFQPSTSFSVDL